MSSTPKTALGEVDQGMSPSSMNSVGVREPAPTAGRARRGGAGGRRPGCSAQVEVRHAAAKRRALRGVIARPLVEELDKLELRTTSPPPWLRRGNVLLVYRGDVDVWELAVGARRSGSPCGRLGRHRPDDDVARRGRGDHLRGRRRRRRRPGLPAATSSDLYVATLLSAVTAVPAAFAADMGQTSWRSRPGAPVRATTARSWGSSRDTGMTMAPFVQAPSGRVRDRGRDEAGAAALDLAIAAT